MEHERISCCWCVNKVFKNKYSLMLTKQRRSGISQIEEHLSTRPSAYSQIFTNSVQPSLSLGQSFFENELNQSKKCES